MKDENKNTINENRIRLRDKESPDIQGEIQSFFYESGYLFFIINSGQDYLINSFFGNIKKNSLVKKDFQFEDKSFLHFFNSSDAQKIELEFSLLAEKVKNISQLECKYKLSATEYIWVEITLKIKRDKNHPQICFLAVLKDIAKRKEAETALNYKYNFILRILDFLPTPVYYKNTKGEFLGINMAYEKLLNCSRNKVIGKDIKELYPADKTDKYHFFEDEAIKTRKILFRDEKITYADGSVHDVLISISPFIQSNLKIGGIVGIISDITQIKKAETALKLSEFHYRQLISFLPEIVLVYADEKILFINDVVQAKLGYTSNGLINQNVFSLVDKKYYGIVSENIKKRCAGEKVPDYKIELISKNGCTLSVIVRGSPIDYNGIKAFIVVLVDVTDQVKNEEQIRRSEIQFRTLWENSFDGMRLVNKDGITILVNNAFCQIVEKTRDELEMQPFNVIYKEANQAQMLKTFSDRTANNQIQLHIKRKIDLWNGKTVWHELTNTVISLTNSPPLILSVFRDITEKIEIEKQLLLSQKMESVGVLAAGIAHEINTPMQYIGDNTSFLKDSLTALIKYFQKIDILFSEHTAPDQLLKTVTECRKLKNELDIDYILEEIPLAIDQTQTGISKVNIIVSALKDFAHPSSKEKSLSDINHGIEVTITISKNQWKYVADLETDLTPGLPYINCILDEINQVILNMIINAVHAIQDKYGSEPNEKGIIEIQTRLIEDQIEIAVSDNGQGIKNENISKIFDPFFTTKEVGKGTGQGLSIAHDIIVTKHKGSISLNSVYGTGTTFIIKLPIS